MKNLHRHLLLATALAAGLAVAPFATGSARAEESATVPTDPGFKPDTRQLNPGATEQSYSKSADVRKVPTPAESRAALRRRRPDLIARIRADAATGQFRRRQQDHESTRHRRCDRRDAGPGRRRRTAFARHLGVQSIGRRGQSARRGTGETTGTRPSTDLKQGRPGPIGATGQTIPAKFSQRNDILDRTPIMAWPLSLSDQDRQQIYKR